MVSVYGGLRIMWGKPDGVIVIVVILISHILVLASRLNARNRQNRENKTPINKGE